MKPNPPSRSPLPGVALSALLFSVAGAVACSSSPKPADTGACSALDACCSAMTGAEASACHDTVSGATDSACATALGTLVQGGGCGGLGFDAGLPGPGIDAALPCSLTGTCPAGTDAGADADAGALPMGTQCEPAGACPDGQSFETCVATDAAGACSAALVFPDGTVLPCASCTNCAAASVSAQGHCATTPPPPVDAGPVCGTPPVLHPEAQAGVYCPFTATGSIHCAAGEECCETPTTVPLGSTCQPEGATCPVTGSLAWGCDGPVDCAGNAAGAVCCAAGTVALDPACGFHRGAGFAGSHCATSCATGEVSICAAPTDPCAAGTQCTAFKMAGVVLGTCL